MALDIVAQHVGEKAIEFAEVGEHHVATSVPGEAGGVDDGGRQAPGSIGGLEHLERLVAEMTQFARTRQSTGPRTDDHHPSRHRAERSSAR